jgi:hypothetical protein
MQVNSALHRNHTPLWHPYRGRFSSTLDLYAGYMLQDLVAGSVAGSLMPLTTLAQAHPPEGGMGMMTGQGGSGGMGMTDGSMMDMMMGSGMDMMGNPA